jgi:hypothetical protein
VHQSGMVFVKPITFFLSPALFIISSKKIYAILSPTLPTALLCDAAGSAACNGGLVRLQQLSGSPTHWVSPLEFDPPDTCTTNILETR